MIRIVVPLACCIATLSPALARGDAPAEDVYFEAKIRPLFVAHCISCHGGEKQKGGLRLDSKAGLLKGSENGPVVVAGEPEKSTLIRAIRYDGDIKMPPKGKLPAMAIEDLQRWVKMGAPWPSSLDVPAKNRAAEIALLKKTHWAFQPVKRVLAPAVRHETWIRSPIDRFILAKLEQAGLTPSGRADKAVLLRRVTFDLVGLPPSPEELADFLADTSEDAYAKVLDRLLASPRYGERWGRHWLDVARYADTKGYYFQEERKFPFSYTYRDYVVNAFNADLPYDRFVVEQLAADRLALGEDKRPLAALGFLTLGRQFMKNKQDILDDQIDVVSRGVLGLTVTCARCHDHKFDPIPMKDYYSLYGVFASSAEPKVLPLLMGNESTEKNKNKGSGVPARAMALEDSRTPYEPRVLIRGNANMPGERVPRQFLSLLSPEPRQPFKQGSGRLELAQAIVRADNPLTARVIVNRVWLHHFGTGLVRTPSDFGSRGEPPTHPELLDYLAARLIDDGWSLKKLHRLILLSSSYQQKSDLSPALQLQDSENRLLARMNRRRLEFEAQRDAILAVAGNLDERRGGPSDELTARPYSARRTIYGFIDRQNLPGLFRNFDFASPDATNPQRYTTTVPLQALFLMNSPFVIEEAKKLSGRAGFDGPGALEKRIEQLYRLLYSRPPGAEETQLGLRFLAGSEGSAKASSMSAWEKYAQVLLLADEFVFVD